VKICRWVGLVETPDGIVELSFGSVGTPTANLVGSSAGSNGGDHTDSWDTGLSERGFNDERSLVDADAILGQPTHSFVIDLTGLGTNQKGILDGNPPAPSYGHSINASGYTDLSLCQHSALIPLTSGIVNGSIANESNIIENGTFVDQGAIKVSDFDGCFESSAPSCESTIPYFKINNFEGFTLVSLPEVSPFTPQFTGLKAVDSFLNFGEQGARVNGKAGQYQQNAIQHHLSFGSLTVPPDRNLVNQSGSFETGFVGLTADQLATTSLRTFERRRYSFLHDGPLAFSVDSVRYVHLDLRGLARLSRRLSMMSPWRFAFVSPRQ
jgi:hypothetical protein